MLTETDRGGPGAVVRRALVGLAIVAASAGVLWWVRARELATGLPCEARGWMGCAVDGPIYAVVAAGVGTGLVALASLVAALGSRGETNRHVAWPWAVAAAIWLVVFVLLLAGARGL